MCMRFPQLLTGNEGGELKSNFDRKMMKMLGIKHHFTIPDPHMHAGNVFAVHDFHTILY